MATIAFYEKLRCATNARQRKSLQSAGHDVRVRDLRAGVPPHGTDMARDPS